MTRAAQLLADRIEMEIDGEWHDVRNLSVSGLKATPEAEPKFPSTRRLTATITMTEEQRREARVMMDCLIFRQWRKTFRAWLLGTCAHA